MSRPDTELPPELVEQVGKETRAGRMLEGTELIAKSIAQAPVAPWSTMPAVGMSLLRLASGR